MTRRKLAVACAVLAAVEQLSAGAWWWANPILTTGRH
jgi:hypothetical protein